MEFKGTKKDWYIDQEESHRMKNSVWCNVISTSSTIGLADVYGDDEEALANAQLIASAPTLLEVLIEVSKHHQGGHSEIGFKIREAIEKTTKID